MADASRLEAFRPGDDFDFLLEEPWTLKTSAWTGAFSMVDLAAPNLPGPAGVVVAFDPLGVNAADATMMDYQVYLAAPASATAKWPKGPRRFACVLTVIDGNGKRVSSYDFLLEFSR